MEDFKKSTYFIKIVIYGRSYYYFFIEWDNKEPVDPTFDAANWAKPREIQLNQ